MESHEQTLKELDLNEKEIKTYISLLMLGKSTVNLISKKSQQNRITTYDILKSLLEKGLVSYTIISGVKNFEAVDPSKFMDILKEKQEKIKSALPYLNSIKASITKKPKIEVFEEIEGLKSIFNDILKENKETWFIGSPSMLNKLEFYFPHFIKRKRRQNIFSKVITQNSPKMRKYKKQSPKKYVHMKFINTPIDTTKILYSKKIAFLTFKEKNSIGILIDNEEIYKTEKEIFNLLWSIAKKQ
jgi:sugar-specific transcriptional regulator TrmB